MPGVPSAEQLCFVWVANGSLVKTAQALLGRSITMPLAPSCPASSPPGCEDQPSSQQRPLASLTLPTLPCCRCCLCALLLLNSAPACLPLHPVAAAVLDIPDVTLTGTYSNLLHHASTLGHLFRTCCKDRHLLIIACHFGCLLCPRRHPKRLLLPTSSAQAMR